MPSVPLVACFGNKTLIRNTESITGVQTGHTTYKLNLFADDMAIFITNPLTSLQSLSDILKTFGSLSGLAVNTHKSELYPINVDSSTKAYITENYLYKWIKLYQNYLGIKISLALINLFQINYYALYQELP